MEAQIIYKNGETMTVETNGNCYILDEKPTFPEDLSVIKVKGDNINLEFHNATVQDCASIDKRYWWCFIEKSSLDLILEQLNAQNETARADIDYCLMIAGE